jgi:hypothetical protein
MANCKHCGLAGLSWKELDVGFRLFDQYGNMHTCLKDKSKSTKQVESIVDHVPTIKEPGPIEKVVMYRVDGILFKTEEQAMLWVKHKSPTQSMKKAMQWDLEEDDMPF